MKKKPYLDSISVCTILLSISVSKNKKLKIVLADDDEDDQVIFREAVEMISPESSIRIFEDGDKLIKWMETSDEVPDIIFLDLNMPKCNGLECLEKIRKNTKFGKVPIVIYSTSNQSVDIEKAFKRGANSYFHKPDDYQSLPKNLDKILATDWKNNQPVFEQFVFRS